MKPIISDASRMITVNVELRRKNWPPTRRSVWIPPAGEIYVVHEGKFRPRGKTCCKVGFTDSGIESRLKHLQTGNSRRLRVYKTWAGSRALESALHNEFWHRKSRGEWFFLTYKDLQRLERLLKNETPFKNAKAKRILSMAEKRYRNSKLVGGKSSRTKTTRLDPGSEEFQRAWIASEKARNHRPSLPRKEDRVQTETK